MGYETPVRKDRNSHGGGIIMYFKNYVHIIRRQDLEHDEIESMWFELKTKLRSILININYKSERQSTDYFWQYFDQLLKNAIVENNCIICLGDLNKNFMSDLPSNIKDIIFINGLINIIDKATHFDTRTSSSSLLDPILVTDSIPVLDKDTIPIDRASACIPTREVTIRCDDKVWFDSNLRRETRKRDRFRKKFMRSHSTSAEHKYKQQRNKVNNLKKQAKKHFYATINENLDELKVANCKQYWKTINMLIKSDRPTHDIPPLRDPDHNFNLAYEGTEKSEILNKYFCSISNINDANKDLPEFDDRCHDFLSQIIVSEQDVLDIISTLDPNKADNDKGNAVSATIFGQLLESFGSNDMGIC
ncbi:unnamed protein product [Mytilus edulis]|uniref:Endonuclease/exonuclease/phosphatase domain-containing protein n=1 Tax=Mytilus edulis TaxID=6550 RepID=A0A8S3PY72_MYTED|nr:unnamed protein product [Mytilus edulis]